MAVITGGRWFDAFRCAQGKVLIIDNELLQERENTPFEPAQKVCARERSTESPSRPLVE